MGVSAIVQDGKIVESAAQSSLSSEKKTSNSTADKEDFLQLLVAQMKYQDPMEPTSNTEWVSQYATFSELEEMQNMSNSLSLSRASTLVGQTVIMESTDSNGRTITTQGNVDYVTYENNKPYLSINGSLYAMDDLAQVVDKAYLEAYKVATSFITGLEKLPSLADLKLDHKEALEEIQGIYENMSSYQKNFLSQDQITTYLDYVKKMSELEALNKNEETADKDGETSETEENA